MHSARCRRWARTSPSWAAELVRAAATLRTSQTTRSTEEASSAGSDFNWRSSCSATGDIRDRIGNRRRFGKGQRAAHGPTATVTYQAEPHPTTKQVDCA